MKMKEKMENWMTGCKKIKKGTGRKREMQERCR